MTRNQAASVRARLKQHAASEKDDFNLTLTRFGLERLLYRLSISRHSGDFLLKGALLFSLWYDHPHRATRDADLLAFGPNDVDHLVNTFREICSIDVNDGVAFDLGGIKAQPIRKQTGYGGVRVDVPATLENARLALQIDIGFGDVVTPHPDHVRYPVLLADLPAPELRAYPKYTVVAEKFHAICLLGLANTRLKDFFDLYVLLHDVDLDPDELRRAISATFERRQTPMPQELPSGLSDDFISSLHTQTQWKAFLRKNRLTECELGDVVVLLRARFAAIGVIGSA